MVNHGRHYSVDCVRWHIARVCEQYLLAAMTYFLGVVVISWVALGMVRLGRFVSTRLRT
jgi:hypothetical protein